jgi:heme/copper-type cytochrome/quinol oxidase subunit 3
MADDDRGRWLARIDATRKYWLFVDVVWLMLVIGFYFWR